MSKVPEILRGDADTYEAKASDYAPDPNDPFENFSFAGRFADRLTRDQFAVTLRPATRQQVAACCVLVGVKISRLMTLGLFGAAKNESVLDTIRDLRVYLAILEAMLRSADQRGGDAAEYAIQARPVAPRG